MAAGCRFEEGYNRRLVGGLLIVAVVDIVIFRFIFRQMLLELLGWFILLTLEVGRVADLIVPLKVPLPVALQLCWGLPLKLLFNCVKSGSTVLSGPIVGFEGGS